MLPLAEFPIRVVRCLRPACVDQTQASSKLQQREIADVAGEFRMLHGKAENEILHDEFDIDDPAAIVFQIEKGGSVGMRIMNFLTHRCDARLECTEVARLAPDHVAASELRAAQDYQRAFLRAHAALLVERARAGYVRDGHGDLRLEHVYREASGEHVIIDCIEFNERFRFADVCADLAFLSMDLRDHGYKACDVAALHEVLETFARAAGLAHIEVRLVSGPLTPSLSIAEHGTIPELAPDRTAPAPAGSFASSIDRFVLQWHSLDGRRRVDHKLAMETGGAIRTILNRSRR